MGEGGKHWYLVYAKPRQESVAQTNLVRQGFETYLPKVHQVVRRQGKRVTVVAPMFPRYLFVHLDDQTSWSPIRSTLGVVSLVRFGPDAAQVPDKLIAVLRQREDAQGVQQLPDTQLQPGSRLRITEGLFAGYEGILLAKSGRDRVVLLLEILGDRARAVVDIDSLEPG